MASPAALLSVMLEVNSGHASAELNRFQGTLQKAGYQVTRLEEGNKRAGRSFDNLHPSASRATQSLGGVAKAALAAGGAFAAFDAAKDAVKSTLELAHSVERLSAITGMDIKTSSQWVEIMKVRGVSSKQTSMAFITLSRNMRNAQDGSKKAVDAFKELGVSQDIVRKGNISDVVLQVADGLQHVSSPARRAAIAQQLFGRGAQALIPILSQGRKGIEDALGAAQRYGAYLPNNVKELRRAREAQFGLNLAMDGLKIAFTTAVLPLLLQGARRLMAFVAQMRSGKGAGGQFASAIKTAFTIVRNVIGAVTRTFGGLGNTIKVALALFAVAKVWKFVGAIRGLLGATGGAEGATKGLAGALGRLQVAGMVVGGVAALAFALRSIAHHGFSATEATSELSPRIRGLANAGNIAGLRRLSARFQDWSGQMKDVNRNASRTFAALARDAANAANRINRIRFDFAGRLGRDLLHGQAISSREIQRILAQFGRLPPGVRTLTARTMVNMTSRLEAGGRVARGTTTQLIASLLNNYHTLRDRGGVYFQQLERTTSKQMERLRWQVAHSSGRAKQQGLDQIHQLRDGMSREFGRMKGQVDRDMPYLAAQIIGGSRDAQRKASAEFFNFQWNVNWAMQHGLISLKKGGQLLRDEGQNLLKSFGSLSKIPFPVAVDNLPAAPRGPHGHMGARGGMVPFGRAGAAGRDNIPVNFGGVPVMVGAGEMGLVLTRHQQKAANAMMAPIGGLHGLFKNVSTPNYMAQGGIVPNLYGHPGNITSSLRNLIGTMEQHFPTLAVTATTDGTHAPGSYHYKGEAVDMAADYSTMYNAAQWVKSSGLYKSLAEGIHNPNLAVKFGQLFSGAGPFGGVWAGHANHIHLAITGALNAIFQQLKVPTIKGHGTIPDMVRALLKKATTAANAYVQTHMPSSLGGSLGGFAGKLSGGVERQVYQFMSANGFDKIAIAGMLGNAMQESSMNPNAAGGGLWQQISNFGSSSGGSLLHQMAVMLPQILGLRGAMNAARTPGDAAVIFEQGFEKAGIPMMANRIRYANEAFAAGFANGGVSRGGWELVGERGPELAHLPGGTRVYPSGESAEMLTPAINMYFAPGTEWLRKFVTVEVESTLRREVRRGDRPLAGRGGGRL